MTLSQTLPRVLASLAAFATIVAGGCSSPTLTGASNIPAGGEARLRLHGGDEELVLRNNGQRALPLRISADGATIDGSPVADAHDSLTPGIARWWDFDGPRLIVISNPGPEPVAIVYRATAESMEVVTSPRISTP